MRRAAAAAFCFACLLATAASAATRPDAKGCQDSPFFSRFPGSYIVSCKHNAFDEVKMPLPDRSKKTVEGEVQYLSYQTEPGHTRLELRRNFSNAFKAAGYTIDTDKDENLLVHKDNVWIYQEIHDASYKATIVKQKEMQQQVVASAKDLQSGINATGHVTANGIFFDTDKADLKPESKPALDEIAKLLKDDSGLRIYVVGHTDNQGALAHNMELSKSRAASVVKALETQYGIPGARLASYGDGPYAPVASNDSEDGRAKNRRVELVKQ